MINISIMNRKDFIHKTGAAAILVSMGVLIDGCTSDTNDVTPDNGKMVTFNLANSPYNVLNTVDSWLLHPTENILLVNVNGAIRAFTSVCTHASCVTDWTYSSPTFTCTCHGSKFNNKGVVTEGPAASNLKEYTVKVDGDIVSITVS
jgi:cytochrome b6-f complex iron-sulfur subunit